MLADAETTPAENALSQLATAEVDRSEQDIAKANAERALKADDAAELATSLNATEHAAPDIEKIRPWATSAMIAAAKAIVGRGGPRNWPAVLDARNLLVDYVNDAAKARDGEDASDLDPAGDYAACLQRTIDHDPSPASARTRLALTLRLNEEGFEVSHYIKELLLAVEYAPKDDGSDGSIAAPDAAVRWDRVLKAFQEVEQITADLEQIEAGATGDFGDAIEVKTIYRAYQLARKTLLETPAPHWGALSVKTNLLLGKYSDPDDTNEWAVAARNFSAAAEQIGLVAPERAGLVEVMTARGHAEKIAFLLANRPTGYAEWAALLDTVGTMADEFGDLISESRDLCDFRTDHLAISSTIVNAVWFTEGGPITKRPKVICEVAKLSDEWSTAIRVYDRLEEVGTGSRQPAKEAEMEAAERRLSEIRDETFNQLPRSRCGVAFQLLSASSLIPLVSGGATEEMKEFARNSLYTAIANTIRVLGLPFDYRAPQYFMGPQIEDLDGRDIGGPAR